jgi:hypothetical protein
MPEGGNLPEGELPGGDLIPEQRATGFATTTLPYILFVAVLLCILCGVPALGYFGYTTYQNQREISQAATATRDAEQWRIAQTVTAEAEAGRAAAATATAGVEAVLVQPPPNWPQQYTDGFDTNSGGWPVGMDDSEWGLLYQEVANGEYVWMADAASNSIWWAEVDAPGEPADCYVSVDASKSEGVPDQVSYGVVIRKTSDTDYYLLDVSETGQFGFWRLVDDEWFTIIDWQDTEAVQPGAVNKLAIRAEGSHFVLMINDRVVGQADDSTFGQGKVGVALSVYAEGQTATVTFDNFEVWAP